MQRILTPAPATPSVNMTNIGFGGETSVAVNPTNPSNLLVTGTGIFDSDHFGFVHVSLDGGRTWGLGNASVSYIDSIIHDGWAFYDPVGTFDSNGDAYVGTLQTGATETSLMNYLFKSTDGGNSFLLTSPFLRMNDTLLFYNNNRTVHPCNAPPVFRDFPGVIADPYRTSPYRNNVYVLVRTSAQITPTRCEYGTAFERSTDGGKTWGSGTWFSSYQLEFLSDNRGMAVAPDGTVFLAGAAANCLFSITCLSFNCPPVTEGSLGMLLKSTDAGASFQSICAVDDPHIGLEGEVEVAASSANTIYVLFLGDNQTVAPNVFHLYSEVSHDGGNSWSAISRVDDVTFPDSGHVTPAGAGPFMWALSLSPQTGRLDVAWLDRRNNDGNYTLADIYYSYSYDAMSWAANIRATPQGPFYMCTQSTNFCIRTGNDFMWITSSYTPGSDKAYIVASLGKASCGYLCSSLLTRFVTVTFPSPSIRVSAFFTDPSLYKLSVDDDGGPSVSVSFANGIVRGTSPSSILAWVNTTNTGSTPLQSIKLNETLPVDWRVDPPWIPAKGAIHVYLANTTSLATDPEITQPSTLTVSTRNQEIVSLAIPRLNNTAVGHPLMPGQSILLSVRLTYALFMTSQPLANYPHNYTDTATVVVWTEPSYTSSGDSANMCDSFTAYARIVGQPSRSRDTSTVAVHRYVVA